MTSSESQVRFSSHTLDKATKAKVIYRNSQITKLHSVHNFDFQDPDPQKYADPWGKISTKN